VIAMIGS